MKIEKKKLLYQVLCFLYLWVDTDRPHFCVAANMERYWGERGGQGPNVDGTGEGMLRGLQEKG